MSYRVIEKFQDSQDSYHFYKAGDLFPRNGKSVSDKRIKELKEREKPLIEEIEKVAVEQKAVEQKIEDKPKRAAKSKAKE